jgi:hypothetical protein
MCTSIYVKDIRKGLWELWVAEQILRNVLSFRTYTGY